ncbi:MAG: spondin domain-containing protein [Cyanobacteria bacterium P01_G01_bin.19]
MTQVSLSTSTTFDGDLNALVEDQGTEITFRIDLDEAAPAEGTRVYIDSEIEQIFNRLDLPAAAANPQIENIDLLSVNTNLDNSGIAFTINPGATFATVTIPIFDNPEPDTFLPETFDGLVEATFSIATEVDEADAEAITGLSEITVDPDAGSSVVIFADDESQLTGDTPTPEPPEEPETPPETPEEPTTPPTGDAPVVSFEVVPDSFSEEAEDNLVEWKWTVTGDFPEEGIVVNLDTSGGDPDVPFDFTNQFAAEPGSEFINAEIVDFDDTGRINILLSAPEASFQLYFADDIIEEGAQPFEFFLAEGEGYTVDPEENGTVFTITDDNGGPGVGPIIGISVSETNLAEGDPLTVTFNVEGDIPEGGVQVLVQSDVFGALGQFDLADLSNLELTGIEGLPEVGDGGGGSFLVTITEPVATITTSVFDDIVAEEALDIEFTLANGELYEVDSDAASVTLNLADETASSGPVIGISLDQTDVFEGETITLTFDVEGEIPEGGVTVLVNDVASAGSQLRSLTEFDVGNFETTGIEGFPEPADGDSGFFVNITEPTATITLPVLDDGADEDEAAESFTFEVIDGEAYDVNSEMGSVTLNITDVGDTTGEPDPTEEPTDPPTDGALNISIDTLAGTFDEDGQLATPNLVLEGVGTPILSLLLSADGEVPEEGLVVNVETDLADITQFIQGSNFVPTAFGGEVLGAIYDSEGIPIGLQVRLDNRNTVVNFNTGFTDPTDGDLPVDISFSLTEGEGYTSAETTTTTTLYQEASQLPTIPEPATVGMNFTSDTGTLTEGGDTGTLNFNVDGEIPEDGLVVFVSNNEFAGIVDFDLLNATTTGGSFPAPDGNAGGFYFKITEANASITFQAIVDETIEGLEEVSVALQSLPSYNIAEGAGEVSILVQETDASEIQVSLETEPDVLIEEEGTVAIFNINLSSPPPEEGIVVSVNSESLDDFDALGLEVTGGGVVNIGNDGTVDILVTEQTATVNVAVSDDGVAEGLETAVFTLVDGDRYQIGEEAEENSSSFTLVDTTAVVPPEAEDPRNSRDSIGDTIAEAQATGLSADNSNITIEAAINGNFFNSDRTITDATEDVDMYSVDLEAGDVLRLDIDAQINSDESPDTVLQIFDADGNAIAQSDDDFAPDELFAPGRRDSYLEFTPETSGTYYIGVSSFGNGQFDFFTNDDGTFENDFYDPNVAGSGAGRSDGVYTLNLSLNEEPSSSATVIPAGTDEGPTISFNASPATYNDDDNLLASALVKFVEDGASILTLSLDTDDEIPEEGIEVYLTSNIDLSSVFSTRAPFTPIGAEVLGAVFDDAGVPVGIKVNLTGNAAVINLNIDNPDEAPNDGTEEISFALEPAAGYQVGDDSTFSTTVYDTLEDVPVMPTVPTVSVEVSETSLIESEGNTTTLTFTLSEPPPAEGLLVNVDSGERAALGEFDVFNAEVSGGDFPSPNFQASGFFFRITEQTASITLAAFDETTNPEIPAEDGIEGVEEFTFAVQPGVGYALDPNASAVTVTIADNPDSVVIPDDGDDNANGSDGLVESEFNDTIAEAMATGLSSTNPVFEVSGEIDNSRQTRNFVDASEDVDIYSFDLEAGQTLLLDVDGGGTGDAGVEGSLLDNILRVFDADGDEVAINENGGAPDEVFQANGDAYLEFTAPESGTYYAGISNLGNNFYDPNEQASGSGWIFEERFEPGPYRFTATLDGNGGTPPVEPPTEPNSVEVKVTIENLAPDAGNFLTPVWVGFHNGEFDLYNRGEAATPGLESLAEDGDVSLLSEEFLGSGFGSVDGAIAGLEGLEGPVDPGEVATATFTLNLNADTSQFFSYASMIIPSNDAFVANGDPTIHNLFDAEGNFIGADFIVAGSEVLDAGTEVNDELAENTAFFFQAEPDTGVDENGVVELHPGFIEGGRILSEDGGTEGAPAAFTSADFTAEGYQVLRITVEEVSVEPPVDGGGDLNPVFGTLDADIIEIDESNQLVFAGSGNDLIDLTQSDGDNRAYAGSGDDILILGENNRIFADDGDDRIFITSGGNNSINGNLGADQFWIANAEIPEAVNIINDFTSGEDVIGIAGLGIGFADVSITDLEGDAVIGAAGSDLAILQGVDATSLTEDDFAFA